MNYLIKTTSRARFSTWAAVKSCFFAAESWAELGAGLRVVWFSADTFQLLTKESKERKKNLHEVQSSAWETASTACKFRKSRSGSTLTSLLYETYLASRLTYFSNLPAQNLVWDVEDLTTNLWLFCRNIIKQVGIPTKARAGFFQIRFGTK